MPRLAGLALKAVAAVALVTAAVEWKRRSSPEPERVASVAVPPRPLPRPTPPAAGLDTRALGAMSGEAARGPAPPRRADR